MATENRWPAPLYDLYFDLLLLICTPFVDRAWGIVCILYLLFCLANYKNHCKWCVHAHRKSYYARKNKYFMYSTAQRYGNHQTHFKLINAFGHFHQRKRKQVFHQHLLPLLFILLPSICFLSCTFSSKSKDAYN